MPTEVSLETRFFTESVIREMTRRALKCGAVNMAQGFPDFAAPQELKQAAKVSIDQEFNQSPSGKAFMRAELETIGTLCRRYDTLVITDEIYEHLLYDGARHVSIATLPGMADRTVTISGLSKTYSNRVASGVCDRLRAHYLSDA